MNDGVQYYPKFPAVGTQQDLWYQDEGFHSVCSGKYGAGKTEGLILNALKYAHVPGYRALLLAGAFSDIMVPGGIQDRLLDAFGSREDFVFDPATQSWIFPSGARLQLGWAEQIDARYYRDRHYQFVGLDGVDRFTEKNYRYVMSLFRDHEYADIPLRLRSTINPSTTPENHWFNSSTDLFARLHPEFAVYEATIYDNPAVDPVLSGAWTK